MKGEIIQPGQAWEARPLSADFLIQQWEAVMHHQSARPALTKLAFTNADWEDWEWNAKEALFLNEKLQSLPTFLRRWVLPQDPINFHLLHASQKLVMSWRQWAELPGIKNSNLLRDRVNVSFLLLSAMGRIDHARTKYDSLIASGKMLQNISLRQHRFYQQLTALYLDLNPIVSLARENAISTEGESSPLASLEKDILWHAKELLRLVGQPDYRPDLVARARVPGVEINRLLGTVCLFHAQFLKSLIRLQLP